MTARHRSLRHRTAVTMVPAAVGAGALIAALLPMTGAQAQPEPNATVAAMVVAQTTVEVTEEPQAPPPAVEGGSLKVTLSTAFLRQMRREGVRVKPVGTATRTGRTFDFPVYAPSAGPGSEAVLLTGGIKLRDRDGDAYRCDTLALTVATGELLCGRGERSTSRFTTTRLLKTTANLITPDTEPTEVVTAPVTVAADARVDAKLGADVLRKDQRMGTMELSVGNAPARSGRDSRSNCEVDDWASDNSINRGWAIQAMVNRIPKDISVSQFDPTTGRSPVPDAAPVTVGQRTPKMDGVSVTASKRIIRGSARSTDNFFSGSTYGCTTWAPYVVGQGGLDEAGVQAWNYDGNIRGLANDPAGRSRTQWWGHARQTNYDGPTGSYTWTCRGLPTGKADTFWARVSQGTGFVGDGVRDQDDAGRAPECRDDNMDGFMLTTRYSISKRGGLEARSDQAEYPRYCSVEGNDLVGCWQEIYPLEWDRAWGFQYHVYASALRAVLESNATIRLTSEYVDFPETRPLAWRISDGDITGAWPKFTDDLGVSRDMSGVATALDQQDLSTTSPFTVPAGSKGRFTLAGYGTPMGNQQMTFLLTADTDGTWEWPTSAITGRPLQRPQIQITVGYTISNFDSGKTCSAKIWYDDGAFGGGRGNDKSGPHCIEGQVPTIWPLPTDSGKLWKRQIDEFITDKDGKQVRNTPTTTFDAKVLTGCGKVDELRIQNTSAKSVPEVGADYTWSIRISGAVTDFSGC